MRSAASVLSLLDPSRFELFPIAIDPAGRWKWVDRARLPQKGQPLLIPDDSPEVILQPHPTAKGGGLLFFKEGNQSQELDAVFPALHGTFCEDGTLQGLLDLAGVAYVGAGVLSSALCMDKEVAKRLAEQRGLPVVPSLTVFKEKFEERFAAFSEEADRKVGFPLFVKPANSGSSVGVRKVKSERDLKSALEYAFQFDLKALVEKAIPAREIEVSVLESAQPGALPEVSIPGEIAPRHEFYSYEAKYLDDQGAELLIPAKLDASQIQEVQSLARAAFIALECEGMARIDFFLDRETSRFYFNESNTLPGFTSISMYPKLWEASGLAPQALLSRLVDLALARHARRKNLLRVYSAKKPC